jgi:hypothetical protein
LAHDGPLDPRCQPFVGEREQPAQNPPLAGSLYQWLGPLPPDGLVGLARAGRADVVTFLAAVSGFRLLQTQTGSARCQFAYARTQRLYPYLDLATKTFVGDNVGARVDGCGSRGRAMLKDKTFSYALWLISAVLTMLAGCTTTTIARLDDNFDKDTVGGPPSTLPQPRPPNDILAYYTTTQTSSTVVSAPYGGNWLRVTPTAAFVVAPDFRKRAIIITSDSFTSSAQIRGHLRVRLDSTGSVHIGIRPIQGSVSADFIGGFTFGNYLLTPGVGGQAFLLNPFSLSDMEGTFGTISSAGKMADFAPGTVLDINWSLDQPSRTLSANVSGGSLGSTQSITFPAVSGGVATTPIGQLGVWVWLEKPANDTAAYLDNLYIEEYK